MSENAMQTPSTVAGSRDAAQPRANSAGLNVLVAGPGYEGFVAIDSIVDGTSAGGVRAAHDLDFEEVRELAHEMSLKFALFQLPRGGAKAGLRIATDVDAAGREAAFMDFGRKLAPLIQNGIYNPGMDMNCGPSELRAIYRGAGIEMGNVTDTAWFTALTVFHALRACVSALDIAHRPIQIAIEGFGSVGRHLAERLDPSEFRIAALSTVEGAARGLQDCEPAELARLKTASGDRFVMELTGERVELHAVPTAAVDILLPSSRTWTLTPELAERVQARAIVPIANAPYAAGTLEILDRKNIVCLPGYLSNVGGVLASSLYDQGVPITDIEQLLATDYRTVVEGIIRAAEKQDVPVTELSETLAGLHERTRAPWRHRSMPRRVYDRFLRRRLPKRVAAFAARRAFAQRMESLRAEIEQMEFVKN